MSRLQANHNTAKILPLSEVPPHDETYAFVNAFLESEKLQEKIDSLLTEKSRIENLPISNAEKIARLKIGYTDFQKKVYDRVAQYLSDCTLWQNGVQNPLMNFETRFYKRDDNLFIPPLSFFEEAIKLQRDDGLSDHDRAKQLAAIDSKIAGLREKMPTVSREDLLFVKFWQELQSQLSEPSSIRAISLDASDDQEKKAWETLGLETFINPRGLRPNPAD